MGDQTYGHHLLVQAENEVEQQQWFTKICDAIIKAMDLYSATNVATKPKQVRTVMVMVVIVMVVVMVMVMVMVMVTFVAARAQGSTR